MIRAYDPSAVEKKWQQKWEEAKLHQADLKKAKDPYYSLVMFPYPSGDKLHVGHWYNFAPADSWARYMKMKGNDVPEPNGLRPVRSPRRELRDQDRHPPRQVHRGEREDDDQAAHADGLH